MTALLPNDTDSAARMMLLYEHFRSRGVCELGATNLALATIQAGAQAVRPGDVLTVAETAERLKVCEDVIYELCASGKLHSMKISQGSGKRAMIRIPLTSLLAYQQAATPEPAAELGRPLRHLKIRQ